MITIKLPETMTPGADLTVPKLYEPNVKALSDERLIEQLKNLFQREKKIGDAILLNLQEINTRRLYAKLGYSSLFEFLVKYFQLSESSAYQRINALKLIQSVPEARTALIKGETNLSTMAATQGFIRKLESEKNAFLSPNEKKDIFEAIKGKTQKEAQAVFAEISPIAFLPVSKEKVLTATHTQLQVTVDQETLALLQEVKNLLSHEIPDGNLNKVLKRISKISIEALKKQKGRNTPTDFHTITHKQEIPDFHSPKMTTTSPVVASSSGTSVGVESFEMKSPKIELDHRSSKQCETRNRYISQAIRRLVFEKAQGCCEFIGANGKRCQSRYQLEIDHQVPWSHGGSNDEANLKLHCRTHNIYRTKETHGFWWGSS